VSWLDDVDLPEGGALHHHGASKEIEDVVDGPTLALDLDAARMAGALIAATLCSAEWRARRDGVSHSR